VPEIVESKQRQVNSGAGFLYRILSLPLARGRFTPYLLRSGNGRKFSDFFPGLGISQRSFITSGGSYRICVGFSGAVFLLFPGGGDYSNAAGVADFGLHRVYSKSYRCISSSVGTFCSTDTAGGYVLFHRYCYWLHTPDTHIILTVQQPCWWPYFLYVYI